MDYNKVVQVVVGSEAKPFLIHESVLTSSSEFLQAAMRSPWAEQREGPIKLDDEDPELFQLYIHWLYRRELVIDAVLLNQLVERSQGSLNGDGSSTSQNENSQQQHNAGQEHEDPEDPEVIILAKALIMGEALMDDAFMTAVETKIVDLLQQGKRFTAGGETGHFIWRKSTPYSRPRQIVIAQALSFAGLYSKRGFRSNVKRGMERLREEDPNNWKLELYAEVIFAQVGLGRDPVTLALGLLKMSPESTLELPDVKSSFDRVQRQAKPPVPERDKPAKRAKLDKEVS